jgi:hypothetical protein
LVGLLPFALAADDSPGTAFGSVDAGTGVVPGDAGFEAAPGTVELRSSPLLGARVLLAAADDDIGPGSAGCAELQPDTTAIATAAIHRIRRPARRRWRGDRTLPFVIVAGWPSARSTVPS